VAQSTQRPPSLQTAGRFFPDPPVKEFPSEEALLEDENGQDVPHYGNGGHDEQEVAELQAKGTPHWQQCVAWKTQWSGATAEQSQGLQLSSARKQSWPPNRPSI